MEYDFDADVAKDIYDPLPFFRLPDRKMEDKLWAWLRTKSMVEKMIQACKDNRPAVEAIAKETAMHLDINVFSYRLRKTVGYMIRFIMDSKGYDWNKKTKCTDNSYFSTGSRYTKRR